MINIFILDEDFEVIESPIDNFNSLIWNRDYYEAGSFQLTCDAEYIDLLRKGRYVYCNAMTEVGIIESVEYMRDDTAVESITVRGRFLLAAMSNHIIAENITMSGTAEYVIRELIRKHNRSLPIVMRDYKGLGDDVETQISYENLYEVVTRLCRAYNISCKLEYDFLEDRIFLDVWQGLDRSEKQHDNNPVVFTDRLDNLLTSRHCHDLTKYKNYAYIGGAITGDTRQIVTLDLTNGGKRYETFVNAGHIRQGSMNAAAYKTQLLAYGREVLASLAAIETVEADVAPDGSFVYRRDFDLGDICTIINPKAGLDVDIRITRVSEVYEDNVTRVNLSFGQDEMNLRNFIKLTNTGVI